MNEAKIQRINELYHKQKTLGLSTEERAEQKALRQEYIQSIRSNLRAELSQVSVINEDGSITNLGDKNAVQKAN